MEGRVNYDAGLWFGHGRLYQAHGICSLSKVNGLLIKAHKKEYHIYVIYLLLRGWI